MKIVHTLSDSASEFNSSRWRSLVPCRALLKAGYDVSIVSIVQWMKHSDEIKRIVADADLIVIQRVMIEESLERAKFWRERGKAIVTDFDDAYQMIDSSNLAHKFWAKGEVEINAPYGVSYTSKLAKHPIDQFIAGVKAYCVGGSMPGKVLAEDWRKHFPCWYVPNYINFDEYLPYRKPKRLGKTITIGYGGSLSHVPSFKLSGVEQALAKVLRKRPQVKLLLCGDKRLYDRMPVPSDRKEYLPYVFWREWAKILNRFDIGIAPMALRYDASRSHIKPIEYVTMGIPFVATKSLAYTDWYEAGLFVPDDVEIESIEERAVLWENMLLDMIDNLSDHTARVESRFSMAEQWEVNRNVPNLISTYEDMISHVN